LPGYGEHPLEGQAKEKAEILDSSVQSLLDLRTPSRVPPQVQDLPSLLPHAGEQGGDSWGPESFVVGQ
jgi:hypothetical protein